VIKYSAYIVDDESLARFALKNKLQAHPEIEVIGEADGITQAAQDIPEKKPNILFLDIQLNDGTGFDLLDKIQYDGKLVFITAFDEYAIRAFEINAIDYLLKPISAKRLKDAIKRIAIQGVERRPKELMKLRYDDRYLVSTSSTLNFVPLKEIALIRSSGDYTELRLSNGKVFLDSRSMHQWELSLPDNHFCRISRFHIINFNFISQVIKDPPSPGLLYIEGHDEPLKISKSYYQVIKARYK
jgi:two-component system LytT family response regulator